MGSDGTRSEQPVPREPVSVAPSPQPHQQHPGIPPMAAAAGAAAAPAAPAAVAAAAAGQPAHLRGRAGTAHCPRSCWRCRGGSRCKLWLPPQPQRCRQVPAGSLQCWWERRCPQGMGSRRRCPPLPLWCRQGMVRTGSLLRSPCMCWGGCSRRAKEAA